MYNLPVKLKRFSSLVLGFWAVFFGSWLIVYLSGVNTLAIQSEDTVPAIFLPVTIIKEGTFYADSYYNSILKKYPHPDDKKFTKGLVPFYFSKIVDPVTGTDHYISAFTVVPGLLSLPVYFFPLLFGLEPTWENLIILSHLSASLIVALSGGFFSLLLRKLVDAKKALLLTVIYLVATVNFAMISQSLWQHGAVQLFTILSLLCLIPESSRNRYYRRIFLSGLFLGLAVLSRPTAMILIPYFIILAIYIWKRDIQDKKLSQEGLLEIAKLKLVFLSGFLPSLAFFLWYNAVYFVSILNQGYADQVGSNWLTPFPWGFLGLWLSPSKGILIYSSVFCFSLVGFILTLKRGIRDNLTYFIFMSIIITHTLILGGWKHWYGGYSFGYRMASDIIPFLVLMLIPYLKSPLYKKTKRLFYFLIVVSLLFELMGMTFFDGIWHGTFDKGFWDQGWLWSLKNSEVIFNIKRLLVKLTL